MHLTRRQFGILLGVGSSPALLAAMTFASQSGGFAQGIIERRVYENADAVPPAALLDRCGMAVVRHEETRAHVELTLFFPSLEERVRAWDRVNSDSEWCTLREGREVRVSSITIGTASGAAV